MAHPRTPPHFPAPDEWPHCGHGTIPEDLVGCRGIHVPGHTSCLAHLADTDRDTYLAGLTPGTDIDHRGTPFTALLLNTLLDALRDPATGHPRLGTARFHSATFQGNAGFGSATFQGIAGFHSATFQGLGGFYSVNFENHANFASATFESVTSFGSAAFEGEAWFYSATFKDDTGFGLATFRGEAGFNWASFQHNVGFESVTFECDASFEQAVFERAARLGPLVCAGWVGLSGVVFGGPVTLSFAARGVECRRTRWSATAELRLRYATVDFSHAVFEYPLRIAAEADAFVLPNGQQTEERAFVGTPDAAVRLTSLRGVDAAHLVLADVDLSGCLLTGTVHLDQLRLEGACSFDNVPPGTYWRHWRPVRFTQRRTLAEEHHWRARQRSRAGTWPCSAPDG
ncbi:pentapeptide repeat-containing protein [Streptomyces sp. NPDC002018]|uniref:pentapeptide repeat-containing protein n=1 Tax=Streptomyces sp. NPDC002018 TaxID=3364629 RepID=UPI00369DFBBB